MAFLEKLKEIEAHLSKIGKVTGNVRASERFTSLENDLVKDHLRHLYELYDELYSIEASSSEIIPPVKEETVEPAAPELKDPVEKREAESPQAPEPAAEAKAEEQETVDEHSSTGKTADEGVSLFEKFQAGAKKREVNTKGLSNKPLKEIIPLNDKFMFIKEFFDNSISKYDEMLERIEEEGKKDKAVDYMKENVWSTDIFEKNEELIERFINILDSKFSD